MHHLTKGAAAKAATRALPEEDPEFQIAPMIDILLVLLVFFMSISSTQVLQTNDKVRLPVAKDSKERRPAEEGVIIVNILWNPLNNVGTIDIDGKEYGSAADIIPVLETNVRAQPDCRVLIRADKEVKYEFLRKVLTSAAGAKIANVTFSVVDKDVPKQP